MDFKLDHAAEILSRTPGVLRTLLQGLSEPWISNNEGAEHLDKIIVVRLGTH